MVEGRGRFPTTHWSKVLAAPGSGSSAHEALSRLCEAYWYPLYVFVRRSERDPERASDLTQSFFARLIEKKDLASVDPARGRFRSWLIACLKHFMSNEWDKERAVKRGGRHQIVSFDALEAEERYRREPVADVDPELLYDQRWAAQVITHALATLQRRYESPDEARFFARVMPLLPQPDIEAGELTPMAEELQTTPGALKTRISRLRQRFWSMVRAEIAETLEDPDDVDSELRYLIEVLGAAWRM